MKKIGINIKLALVAGIINCVAWYVFAKQFGFYNANVYFYKHFTSIILLLVGISLSVFLIKRSNAGILPFKDGLKAGMMYSLILAIILAIFNYIYHTFITPDTIDFFLNEAKKMAAQEHLNEEQVLKNARRTFSSFTIIPSILFFGLIFSLLSSAIFQKKGNPVADN